MCQYPIVLYYMVEAQKRYFCACRLSLHNPAPSQRTRLGVCISIKAVTVTRYINALSRSCISMITRKSLIGVTCK